MLEHALHSLKGVAITVANVTGMTIDGILISELLLAYRAGR